MRNYTYKHVCKETYKVYVSFNCSITSKRQSETERGRGELTSNHGPITYMSDR